MNRFKVKSWPRPVVAERWFDSLESDTTEPDWWCEFTVEKIELAQLLFDTVPVGLARLDVAGPTGKHEFGGPFFESRGKVEEV